RSRSQISQAALLREGTYSSLSAESKRGYTGYAVERLEVQLLAVLRRLGAFFECLAVPDPALAGITREFKILGELEGIDGTGIFAQAAEHAAARAAGRAA